MVGAGFASETIHFDVVVRNDDTNSWSWSMDVSRDVSIILPSTANSRTGVRCLSVAAAVVLMAANLARPVAAADCGECDAGCQLEADAFNLMEAYAGDKAGFAARSNRCAETDALWTEIYENIREMDQPPPKTEVKRRREVSKLELAMINHDLGISYCMEFCGLERFQEICGSGTPQSLCVLLGVIARLHSTAVRSGAGLRGQRRNRRGARDRQLIRPHGGTEQGLQEWWHAARWEPARPFRPSSKG